MSHVFVSHLVKKLVMYVCVLLQCTNTIDTYMYFVSISLMLWYEIKELLSKFDFNDENTWKLVFKILYEKKFKKSIYCNIYRNMPPNIAIYRNMIFLAISTPINTYHFVMVHFTNCIKTLKYSCMCYDVHWDMFVFLRY